MNYKFIGTVGLIIFLSGCAGVFEKPPVEADYGSTPSGYEYSATLVIKPNLKDPESAMYRFGQPVKGYRNRGLVEGGQVDWHGWMVDVWVNSKNSFGGYAGESHYVVLYNGDNPWFLVTHANHPLLHRVPTTDADRKSATINYKQIITETQSVDGIQIEVTSRGLMWDVSAVNQTDQMVNVLWGESAYVNSVGVSVRLVRSVGEAFETSAAQPSSPIPPGGTLKQSVAMEGITPASGVASSAPVTPSDPQGIAKLFLVVEINGKKHLWQAEIRFELLSGRQG